MSYQVLARKWRPMTFAELSGQEHVVTALANSLSRGRIHHAYLLTGTRGVGKTTIARILAKSLNCITGVTATPCGVCAACTDIDAGRFVDLLELDAASNTGIDNMREILDNARYAPTVGRYKVYLIDEVHMLSKAAFNSMLKTLEEPPEHVRFVLATTDPQKIPVTVLSRCLQFNLKPLTPALIGARIEHILAAEDIAFESGAVTLIAHAAQGSLRDGLSLLDQAIAFGGGEVNESVVRTMLGTVDREHVYRIADALAAGDGPALLAESDALTSRGLASGLALDELSSLFHRVAVAQVVPAAAVAFDDAQRVIGLAGRFTPEIVQVLYQIAAQGRADLALAPDEATGLSMTLLRMLAFAPAAAASPSPEANRVAPAPVAPKAPAMAAPAPAVPRSSALPADHARTANAQAASETRVADPAPARERGAAADRRRGVAGIRRRIEADRHGRAARRPDRTHGHRRPRAHAGTAGGAQAPGRQGVRRQVEARARTGDGASTAACLRSGRAGRVIAGRDRETRARASPGQGRGGVPRRTLCPRLDRHVRRPGENR